MMRANRLGAVRAVGMLQCTIADAERGAELLAGEIAVDQAKVEGEFVRVSGQQSLVAESNRLGCDQVDVVDDVGGPDFGK